jgi:hypothetical protein
MRTVRWLAAAGLLASATGCIEINGLPNTSMGGYPSGYNYPSSGYYGQPGYSTGGGLLNSLFSQPTYYPQAYPQAYQSAPQYIPVPVAQPQVITQPQYVPGSTTGRRTWANRDRNNNGIPDWKERDRNGNGIPDWQERRPNRSG